MTPKEKTKQETAVQYLKRMRDTYGFITTNDFKRADEMFERQIEKSFMKNLPIEDGVITAVQKAEQYYNETFNKQIRYDSNTRIDFRV
jgi:hypothetical protein